MANQITNEFASGKIYVSTNNTTNVKSYLSIIEVQNIIMVIRNCYYEQSYVINLIMIYILNIMNIFLLILQKKWEWFYFVRDNFLRKIYITI